MEIVLEEFLRQAREATDKFDKFARSHDVQKLARADHICYKCGSRKSFESIRTMLEGYSDFAYQSVISERRIAYIKLRGSVPSELGPIRFIELSDQKPDGSQVEGFDHIEVYPLAGTYIEMIVWLGKAGIQLTKVKRPHHTTHDADIGNGFIFRCSPGPLLDKIKREEFI